MLVLVYCIIGEIGWQLSFHIALNALRDWEGSIAFSAISAFGQALVTGLNTISLTQQLYVIHEAFHYTSMPLLNPTGHPWIQLYNEIAK